jgi:hypothetical protein
MRREVAIEDLNLFKKMAFFSRRKPAVAGLAGMSMPGL